MDPGKGGAGGPTHNPNLLPVWGGEGETTLFHFFIFVEHFLSFFIFFIFCLLSFLWGEFFSAFFFSLIFCLFLIFLIEKNIVFF